MKIILVWLSIMGLVVGGAIALFYQPTDSFIIIALLLVCCAVIIVLNIRAMNAEDKDDDLIK